MKLLKWFKKRNVQKDRIKQEKENEKIMEWERNQVINRVTTTCKELGLYTEEQLKVLPEDELDLLIKFQYTCERIIRNNPIELIDTIYSGQGKTVKDIFPQVKCAYYFMKCCGKDEILYDYICNGILKDQNDNELGGFIYQQIEPMVEWPKFPIIKSAPIGWRENYDENSELTEETEEIKRGL